MRRAVRLLLACACCAVAACGGGESAGDVAAIRAWPSEPPYLPPPEPAPPPDGEGRTTAVSAPRGDPVVDARRTAATGEAAGGAPSDAQVARDLERALGTDAATAVDSATITASGLATTPPAAPVRVAAIIRAANEVARKPYVYGGGHGRLAEETFIDSAYDCSGSISFALASAGYIEAPMNSTALEGFGRPGAGRWVTIYANAEHAFMTVAGLRFDTSGRQRTGTRWQGASRSVAGFTVRHPPGL